jgi:hypothetical protein
MAIVRQLLHTHPQTIRKSKPTNHHLSCSKRPITVDLVEITSLSVSSISPSLRIASRSLASTAQVPAIDPNHRKSVVLVLAGFIADVQHPLVPAPKLIEGVICGDFVGLFVGFAGVPAESSAGVGAAVENSSFGTHVYWVKCLNGSC